MQSEPTVLSGFQQSTNYQIYFAFIAQLRSHRANYDDVIDRTNVHMVAHIIIIMFES